MFPLLIPLLGLIPNLLHLFGASSDTDTAATTAVNIATQVAGIADPQAAIAAIAANPQLQVQMQQQITAQVSAIAQANATAIAAVNSTMVAEAAQKRGYWRDACGWVVAGGSLLGVIATCWLFYQGLVEQNVQAIGLIPTLTLALTTLLAVPGSAVGITAWHDGKTQQIQAQNQAN